jgi:hypothetical protein
VSSYDWSKHDDGGEFAPWWAPTIGDVLDGKAVRSTRRSRSSAASMP